MVQKDSKILEMCKNLNFPQGKLSDEYLFTIQAVDLFYYKKNIVFCIIDIYYICHPYYRVADISVG